MRYYNNSNELLLKVKAIIPEGSQTFSKSYLNYPRGVSPLFVSHGKGCHIWDIDGNEYVDLVSGLLAVVLGYQDPDVDRAIKNQLENGISFSLPTELEFKLASKLVALIPCAEMVRFGKNGSDVTSAAIRLARAYTGRDRIACCGYHGWHEWYIGTTTRNGGIPGAVSELTHKFAYNDIDSLEKVFGAHKNEFAAVIMEPMNLEEPKDNFLQQVKDLAHKHGALFILDEIISGFRFHIGGAQAKFNVAPDLATFGKAIGNGMPISALVGRADVMELMSNIFFSGTFGGETLSLAASIAVIDKMQKENIIESLYAKGEYLTHQVEAKIKSHGLTETFSLSGLPVWTFLKIKSHKTLPDIMIKTLFIREMLKRGVLIQATHNITYAHADADFALVLSAYDEVLSHIHEVLSGKMPVDLSEGDCITSAFSVRK